MIELGFEQKQRIGFAYVMELLTPASPYGRELLRELQPACPGEETALRLEFQNIAKTLTARLSLEKPYARLENVFRQVKDIRGSIARIGGELSDVDLFELKRYLLQLVEIVALFGEINVETAYHGIVFEETLPALELLDPEKNRVAAFHISGRYSHVLTAIRNEKREVEQQLRTMLAGEERSALLERRGELVAREQEEEGVIRAFLSRGLLPWMEAMSQNADAIGRLDLTIQKAKLAAEHGGCMPTIGENLLSFNGMINPQIAQWLTDKGRSFTPLSLSLQAGATVLTGANMGGKSVVLKTLALNVLLLHCGFYPFAQEAVCPLFDGLHLVSEDLEAADRGLSSFAGEIVRLEEVLQEAEKGRSLILLDEFAKGTNPAEGGAIARGVCAYLNAQSAYTVMATHYEGLSALAGAHYQVVGLQRMDITDLFGKTAGASVEDRLALIARCMDYGILPAAGENLPMDAVNICRLLGLSEEILNLIEKFHTKFPGESADEIAHSI